MGYVDVLVLLIASLHFCISDHMCPPSNVISPCTCDGEGINCMKAKTDWELQKIFRSIPKPWKTRAVWIQLTDMANVPAGMFQGIETQNFYLEVNRIHTIQSGAFRGSENTVTSISVFGNELTGFPWDDLKNFVYLQRFNAGRNKLMAIPHDAFSGHNSLYEIILPENRITYIGPNAFNNLPNLGKLDLFHNRINVLDPYSFSMSSHRPELTVNLFNCSITTVSPTAFNGMTPKMLHLTSNSLQHLEQDSFLPMVQRMAKIGGQIELSGNRLTCYGCSYNWIVYNKAVLQNILIGFYCQDGRTLDSLTNRNIGCNFS